MPSVLANGFADSGMDTDTGIKPGGLGNTRRGERISTLVDLRWRSAQPEKLELSCNLLN